ncbi:MAG: hypothetical protein GY861_05295 [bacterium]|nr:hypothetical protein [bacterium]
MIEIIIILILAGLLGWKEYSSRKERENYLDAILSKDATDLANIKIAKKIKPIPPDRPPDLMSIDDMDVDSSEFKKVMEHGEEN